MASTPTRSTATRARTRASARWKTSRKARSRCWSRPTSPRAASATPLDTRERNRGRGRRPHQSGPQEKRPTPAGQGRGEGRNNAARQQRSPEGRPPRPPEARPPRSRNEKRDDRAPRYANSPAPRTSGNSGGMDFNKPYEPSTPNAGAPTEPADASGAKKRSPQAIPALFRKKAA